MGGFWDTQGAFPGSDSMIPLRGYGTCRRRRPKSSGSYVTSCGCTRCSTVFFEWVSGRNEVGKGVSICTVYSNLLFNEMFCQFFEISCFRLMNIIVYTMIEWYEQNIWGLMVQAGGSEFGVAVPIPTWPNFQWQWWCPLNPLVDRTFFLVMRELSLFFKPLI